MPPTLNYPMIYYMLIICRFPLSDMCPRAIHVVINIGVVWWRKAMATDNTMTWLYTQHWAQT